MNVAFSAHQRNTDFKRAWRLAAIAMVTIRFVQGWICWDSGSRRFFYAPSQINPDTHTG